MTEQKKSDSQLATAEKIAPNDEKSANALEKSSNDAHELSQDELQAVSGGTDDNCRDNYACGVTEQCAKKAFCNLYIL